MKNDFIKEIDAIKPKYKLGANVYYLSGLLIIKGKITSIDVRIIEKRTGDKSEEYLGIKYSVNFDRFLDENTIFSSIKELKDSLILINDENQD